jgi:hypothetical protein
MYVYEIINISCEDSNLLGCDTVYLDLGFPAFQKNVMPSSSRVGRGVNPSWTPLEEPPQPVISSDIEVRSSRRVQNTLLLLFLPAKEIEESIIQHYPR